MSDFETLSIYCHGPLVEITEPAEVFVRESHYLIHFIATPFVLASKMDKTLADLFSQFGDIRGAVINYSDALEVYKGTSTDLLHSQLVNHYLNYLIDILISVNSIKLGTPEEENIISSVLKSTRAGFKDLKRMLKRHFDIEICPNPPDYEHLRKAIEFRNVYVHNHGIVGETYLRRIPESNFTHGDRIHSQGQGWATLLGKLVLDVDQQVIDKFPDINRRRIHNSELCRILGRI